MPATVPRSPSLPPELLTVNQVAELLGISPRLVWRLAELGDLIPVHIRSCTRWRRAELMRYIDRLAAEQTAEEAGRE
jgi:predicted DNA-binding transcriptional regulator AlpA